LISYIEIWRNKIHLYSLKWRIESFCQPANCVSRRQATGGRREIADSVYLRLIPPVLIFVITPLLSFCCRSAALLPFCITHQLLAKSL